jgi:hypothetical protein
MSMVDAANLILRRRFPAPWTVEKIAGGLKVVDANGQSLAYVYPHATIPTPRTLQGC